MSKLTDESLVVLVQQCQFLPARQELLLRYYDWMLGRIAALAHSRGLRGADCDDAQGEAVSALLEAIAHYDTEQLVNKVGRSFRSFQGTVVKRRFADFLKKLRRHRRRYRPFAFPVEAGAQRDTPPSKRGLSHLTVIGPYEEAVRREELACLQQALNGLSKKQRRLWDRLAAGGSLSDIAREWAVPYDRVRRWRRKLLVEVATCVKAARLS
jgi:RNA polymerase sigma factor (sigma-70 family)